MADVPKRKGHRGRFRTAADAADQLADIEAAQRAVRAGKLSRKIDSTRKSKHRFRNMVDQLKDPDEIKDEFQ